jgi:hypothetical protein
MEDGFGRSVGGSSVGGNGRMKRGMPGRGQERERDTQCAQTGRERADGGALSFAPSFHETVRSPKNSVRPTQRRPARPPKLQPDYVLSAQSIKYSINEGVMNLEPPHSNSLMTNDTEDGIQEGQERGGTTRYLSLVSIIVKIHIREFEIDFDQDVQLMYESLMRERERLVKEKD